MNNSVKQVASTTELASETASKAAKADGGVSEAKASETEGKATAAATGAVNSNLASKTTQKTGPLALDLQYFSNNTALKEAELGMDLQASAKSIDRVNTWNEFQKNHKKMFATRSEAAKEYKKLVTEQSPWPIGYPPEEITLKQGTIFEMAVAPKQPVTMPGGFGTFDTITDVEFVRNNLAVKYDWKKKIDRVVKYEIIKDLPARVGSVGPQIDKKTGKYLPGGGSQFEMLVPYDERMLYLRVIGEREIQ
jgi:hypothetical protein